MGTERSRAAPYRSDPREICEAGLTFRERARSWNVGLPQGGKTGHVGGTSVLLLDDGREALVPDDRRMPRHPMWELRRHGRAALALG